jgi:DNA-binding transcriptional MocR family regulator|tara:strand:+ start:3724 stop:4944 length:1221 start_codon:yes stop_codon:yes gene_type:complete
MNLNLTLQEAEDLYLKLSSKNLNLDLTRGKPHADQLELSEKMESSLSGNYFFEGVDTRNYGELLGLEACRQLGADLLGCRKEMVIAGGNSSLTLMSQYLSSLYFQGTGHGPFSLDKRTSFLCPVPGYDRHFKLCEEFSINMIPVPLTGCGPDIDYIKSIIDNDDSIKGIWCVPKHSNPTGETYSEDNVYELLAIAKRLNKDFRIFWDNAYAVHDFKESPSLPNIFSMASKLKVEESVIGFGSTSKISFAGAGISFIGMSEENLSRFIKHYSSMVIGPDKVNQARHIMFFKNFNGLLSHMQKHAEILRPKFEIVEKWLSKQSFGTWTHPTGGYFVSFNSKPGLAKEIIKLSNSSGLKLSPAGSTFPYGVDPNDENIRLAPTACSNEELESAMELFVTCVVLANLRGS